MRDKWIAWRCDKIHEFFLHVRDRVIRARDDLDVILSLYIDNRPAIDWAQQQKPIEQYLREWGYDLSLFRGDRQLRVSRWLNAVLHSDPARRRPGYAAGWEQFAGPEFVDLYAEFERPAATIMHQWFEINLRAPNHPSYASSCRPPGRPTATHRPCRTGTGCKRCRGRVP